MAFKHTGFWQPMDTLNDKLYLQEIWIRRNLLGKIGINKLKEGYCVQRTIKYNKG
ncbi:NDP-sugar pyrophosphorylase family protein [Neobacillus sp. B4I6]|uniref:hypothetical protein n=1 Tax=Neobacillus sp. B4I6 TaxID=3373925 RepID=UPI003D1DC0E6